MSPLKFFASAHARTRSSAQPPDTKTRQPPQQAKPPAPIPPTTRPPGAAPDANAPIARKRPPGAAPDANAPIARKRPSAVCPYCRSFVEKPPEYRGICQRCGQTYYVRTRPGDSWPSLLTARQAAAIDENRATQPRLTTRQEAHEEARSWRFNWFWTYSTAEGQWRSFKRAATLHARDGNWLLYRNARYGMAELRRKQARLRESLDLYLEVWYLDLNGPHDCWGVIGARRVYETAPFAPDHGLTTPSVARWVNRVCVRLDLDKPQIEHLFNDIAMRAYRQLNLPLTPNDAWKSVAEEIVV